MQDLEALVNELATALRQRRWRMASAESCTGGMVAAACTSVAGSSDWFERGFVTYSNEAKTSLLGVPTSLIAQHGAVSEPVAQAMATGAVKQAPVQCAVAITGIAGPGGAVPGKPVGTVWLAWALAPAAGAAPLVRTRGVLLPGTRQQVREASQGLALEGLLQLLREPGHQGHSA